MPDLVFVIIVGFGAQVVDGALGMASGLIATTSMLAFGVGGRPAAPGAARNLAPALSICPPVLRL